MQAKEIAIDTINQLPENVGFEDIINALYIKAKFDKGIKDIKNNKGIGHEEAKKRLSKWLK